MKSLTKNSGIYRMNRCMRKLYLFDRDNFFSLILVPVFAVSLYFLIFHEGDSLYALFPPWFSWIFFSSMVFSMGYFVFLALSALTYREMKEDIQGEKEFPSCTILVPAYNEGRHVADTLKSLLDVEYPAAKLEIIAINDGSKDDTLYWIRHAERMAPARIRSIDLEKNGGKKHALYVGMKQAKGEYIVTVDSDSLVDKKAVKKLMIPFSDPSIGAVAGNIRGKKNAGNFFEQMMDVLLIFGCEFLRSGQSVTGNVFCTPGALSAYRKSALLPLLDEWLSQRFLGVASTIGEDRAIATLLRREKYKIIHQKDALAETCLPDTYKGMVKMLIRWTRSDIRENFLMAGTVIKNLSHCSWQQISYFIHWFSIFINMFLPFVFLPALLLAFFLTEHIFYQTAMVIFSVILWSLLPAVVYGKERGICKINRAFVFGFFTLFFLSWMPIYCTFTVRNSKWLTREKNSPASHEKQ